MNSKWYLDFRRQLLQIHLPEQFALQSTATKRARVDLPMKQGLQEWEAPVKHCSHCFTGVGSRVVFLLRVKPTSAAAAEPDQPQLFLQPRHTIEQNYFYPFHSPNTHCYYFLQIPNEQKILHAILKHANFSPHISGPPIVLFNSTNCRETRG
jgi:hypothetical protein